MASALGEIKHGNGRRPRPPPRNPSGRRWPQGSASMQEALTPGAQRALDRAQVRARLRGAASVEPADLLAAFADEAESRASELLTEFGLEPKRLLSALGAAEAVPADDPTDDAEI